MATRALDHTELLTAAEMLARAFADDPLIQYVYPDEAQRTRLLPHFMRGALRLSFPEGYVTTVDDVRGVAAFLPPGRTRFSLGRQARVMLPELFRHGFGVMGRLIGVLDELEHKHPREPHWYVFLIGVDPAAQRRGHGVEMMSTVMARADEGRVPVYLETHREENVSYYQRLGFEIRENFRARGGKGPETWTLLRPPATASRRR